MSISSLADIKVQQLSPQSSPLELNTYVEKAQWRETAPIKFTADQRSHTTIWVSGLTLNHDTLIAAALRGIGYQVQNFSVPNNEALRIGKEFGNRGQCNPTYYTVGNLIKHLQALEAGGLSRESIINNHVFATGGSCGPCRFGMYLTEYRKALRDAGFGGFRILLFDQQLEIKDVNKESGIMFDSSFYLGLIKAVVAGDVLNLMGYRLRPYEVEAGATNKAMQICKDILVTAFEENNSVTLALWRCRKVLEKVEVNWLEVKPKVSIIGEFWAMTTEGEGNYELQSFLEQEGAEVTIQPVSNWLFYLMWDKIDGVEKRRHLRGQDHTRLGLGGKSVVKKLLLYKTAMIGLKAWFRISALTIGLKHHHLPDMKKLADLAGQHYDTLIKGGEGHLEVAKLIDTVEDKRAHMVISVKPFGCMPSSGISDGVQSLITARYPEAIFCPIETSGSGKVNVQSRVQMMLFKAHQRSREEFEKVLENTGLEESELNSKIKKSSSLNYPPHHWACTAANMVYK